ncbi:hypothetical protein ACP275_03G057100 [Erythranthe tilingii]
MHASANLLLHTPSSIIPSTPPKTTTYSASNISQSPPPAKPFFLSPPQTNTIFRRGNFSVCRASQYSPMAEFNLYELLGIDASSDKAQIKEAYRSLQKRCHPDIAGPSGHDMAIVLNEAYALLSDPISRLAYDKELAKITDMQGYTGKPIYSSWFGSESEERAVFVDEVKCIGCLKCALLAENTFAVESVYGRARVVSQWADSENKIQEAIGACPVDCISIVERSNLAALEFVMSKQTRGKVRIGASNTAGERTLDIFDEVEKFQARYDKHKASAKFSKESDDYRASKLSAIQAIQMISNWLYWQSPIENANSPATQRSQPRKQFGPNIKKLKAAAEARKQAPTTKVLPKESDEYWTPSAVVPPEATTPDSSPKDSTSYSRKRVRNNNNNNNELLIRRKVDSNSPFRWGVPIGTALVAVIVVRSQLGEHVADVKDHAGGSLLLTIVNSSWLQCVLAGVTWYIIGIFVVELVETLRRK